MSRPTSASMPRLAPGPDLGTHAAHDSSDSVPENGPEHGPDHEYGVGELGESLEMYLKTVFHLVNERRVARVRDIAERRNVRMPSVTGALKRLAKEGLVDYEAREFVVLTPQGELLAKQIIERSQYLEKFLNQVLQLDAIAAERDACVLEHYVSPETLDRLVAFNDFLVQQPTEVTEMAKKFSAFLATRVTPSSILGPGVSAPVPSDNN